MGRRPLAESRNISLESRYKQRLAEPPWTAQEDIVAEMYHIPDVLSLIYIKTIKVNHLGECLYAHRQSLQSLLFHISCVIWLQS